MEYMIGLVFLGIAALTYVFVVALLGTLKEEEEENFIFTKDGEKIPFNEDDQE